MRLSSVLVISDNLPRCVPVLSMLRGCGCAPVVIEQAAQLASSMEAHRSPLFILLIGRKEFCCPFFQVLIDLRNRALVPPLVVLAAQSSESFAISALRCAAADYLVEPVDLNRLAECVSRWLPGNPATGADCLTGGEIMVGSSPAMQSLRAYIRRLGSTDCNVLITGETGTGKELVAQLIHQNSTRCEHPLICINCAAIPDSLLESELFGYESGAFTGATRSNQGKLMTANKGTVFFDEIGDMSHYAQAKILRAIESKEVQRLGANRKYHTDIRILAATHHNLDDLAGTEKFRRDLYFRLNVGRIHLPPLRERKSDIPGLVQRMVADLNQNTGRHVEGLTADALVRLTLYDWPGNIRELKNTLERIFIIRDEGRITEGDLPLAMQQPAGACGKSSHYTPNDHFGSSMNGWPMSNDEGELDTLKAVLTSCNGNKKMAAEKLNWSRMTLYRKLAKYKSKEEPEKPKPAAGKDKQQDEKKLA